MVNANCLQTNGWGLPYYLTVWDAEFCTFDLSCLVSMRISPKEISHFQLCQKEVAPAYSMLPRPPPSGDTHMLAQR